MRLTYGIIGVGALGGYFGGRLAEAGYDVHFLLHSEYEYIKQNGLRVDSVDGDFHLHEINVYKSAADMPPCDIVLVSLKATQNYLLKKMLLPLLKPTTVIVLVQNGLGAEAELAKHFPNLSIAGGLAFIGSARVAPGHIAHSDYGRITVGLYQGDGWAVLEEMKLDFMQNKVEIQLIDDLKYARWQKLVWNIPYNGLSVVMNTTCDYLNAQPDMRQLIHDIMIEVIEAANACGAKLDETEAEKMLAHTDNMQPYSPSMKLDFEHRRPMEIEAIYSNPLKAASAHGYDMHKVRMLEQQLLFIQEKMLE